jgi:hypothetical protein
MLVERLGKLQSVGGNLFLRDTNITKDDIQHINVGGIIILNG